jgi:hypothetical protein
MEVCYWALLFLPLVILQYLYSLQIKGDSQKKNLFPSRNSKQYSISHMSNLCVNHYYIWHCALIDMKFPLKVALSASTFMNTKLKKYERKLALKGNSFCRSLQVHRKKQVLPIEATLTRWPCFPLCFESLMLRVSSSLCVEFVNERKQTDIQSHAPVVRRCFLPWTVLTVSV